MKTWDSRIGVTVRYTEDQIDDFAALSTEIRDVYRRYEGKFQDVDIKWEPLES